MAKMKQLYTEIVELLEDADNTPLLISRRLNVPVEYVLDVIENLEGDYFE